MVAAFCLLALTSIAQSSNNYSLLWRISRPGTSEGAYLFGTMHDNGAAAYQMSDSVLVAFDRCSMAAFELNHDSVMDVFVQYVSQLTKNSGRQSKAKSTILERVRTELELSPQENEVVAEPAASKQLAHYPLQHLDQYLQARAHSQGLRVIGLERAKDQMEMLLNNADTLDYDRMLTDSLYFLRHRQYLRAMVSGRIEHTEFAMPLEDAYSRGDLDAIEKMVMQYEKGALQLGQRNRSILAVVLSLLANERVFIAVGAAHLVGTEGLINLLRNAGYKVEKVEATFTGIAQQMLAQPLRKKAWVDFSNQFLGASLKFPSAPSKLENADVWISLDMDALRSYGVSSQVFMPTDNQQSAVEDHLRTKLKSPRLSNVSNVSKRKVREGFAAEATAMVDNNYVYYTAEMHYGRLYTLFVTSGEPVNADNQDVKYFLSNIIFFPVPSASPFPVNTKEYRNEHGGYKMNITGDYKEERREELTEAADGISKEVMYMTSFKLGQSPDQMLVRFSDAPGGRYFNEREEVFGVINANFESLRGMPNCDVSSKDTLIGDITWRYTRARYLGSENITLCYLRGTRIYVLAFSGGERSLRDFWTAVSTFEFLPLPSMPIAHADELGIQTPRTLLSEMVRDMEDTTLPIDFLEVKQCTDTLSGALYNVIRYHLHPFFAAQNTHALLQEIGTAMVEEEMVENEDGWTDDVVEVVQDDSLLYHARVTSPRNDLLIEIKTLALGRDVLTLQSIRPAEQVHDANAELFLSTQHLRALSDSGFRSGNVLKFLADLPYADPKHKPKMLAMAGYLAPKDIGFEAFSEVLNALHEKPGTEDQGELSWLLDQLIALDTLRALPLIQKWVTVKKNSALYDAASYKMSFVAHPLYVRFYLRFLSGLECPSQESSLLGLWWNSYDLLTMIDEMKQYCSQGNQCMMDYMSVVLSNNADSLITKEIIDEQILDWMLAAANRARSGSLEAKDTEQLITPQDVLYHTTRVLSVRADVPKVVTWLHGLLDSNMPLQVRAEAIKPLLRNRDANIASALDALLTNDHTGFDIKFWAYSNGLWSSIPEKHRDLSAYCRQYLQYVIDQEAEGDTENALVKSAGSTVVKTKNGDRVFHHCTVQWQGEEGEDAYSFGPFPPNEMIFDVSESFYLVGRDGYPNLKKALDTEAKKMAEQVGQVED